MGYQEDDFYNRSYLGGNNMSQQIQVNPETSDTASKVSLMTGAATVPFMSTPAGAAVMVGSQFLTQYLAQKAADERAKRDRAVQIAQQHGQDEQKGFDQLINVYRGALR